jgi:peptide/nickel transport system ATP-binding protein
MTVTETAAAGSVDDLTPTLQVEHLEVTHRVRGDDRRALRDVSFQIGRRESYGLVGESGSGKSTVALALTRYLPRNGRVTGGRISINGQDPLAMDAEALRALRARTVSMVYQEPGKALNPSIRVGRQVAEVYEVAGLDRSVAQDKAEAMLRTVQISDPGRVMGLYPHQISGGMAQRVVVAMALAAEPSLLILDEPTTALDATVEAEVLDLVAALREDFATSVLFISHNLAVIAKMCDRVGVLYAGELLEEGPAQQVFEEPRHPYTVGLLRCIPPRQRKDAGRLHIPGFLRPPTRSPGASSPARPIAELQCREAPPASMSARGEVARYLHDATSDLPEHPGRASWRRSRDRPRVVALRGVSGRPSPTAASRCGPWSASTSASSEARRRFGLVGESGSAGPPWPGPCSASSRGQRLGVELDGTALAAEARRRPREQLKALQIVFQNPDSALNRRHTVRHLISRPLSRLAGLSGARLRERLTDLVRSVRLEERHLSLRPSQLSGGLKQRVAIARAFGGGPRIVVCDEPTSALDVSVQAAILNLLADLQAKEQVTYLFISHDLGVVRYLSDRIAVLYLGRIMELGPAETVFAGPHHPYTEALLSAVPSIDGQRADRIRLHGEIPSAADPPSGCVFHTRCPRRLSTGICETSEPPLAEVAPGHLMSCHIPIDQLTILQRTEQNSD